MDALAGSGLLASLADSTIGLVTWLLDGTDGTDGAEIRALAVRSDTRGRGVGRALLEAAHDSIRLTGGRRAWLVTTNDNLAALRLYQRAGYRLVALRAGAVDDARRALKPTIPLIGEGGIPIRDELVLEAAL